eukprot:360105-Chlamydomonas_euryale.AAC.3
MYLVQQSGRCRGNAAAAPHSVRSRGRTWLRRANRKATLKARRSACALRPRALRPVVAGVRRDGERGGELGGTNGRAGRVLGGAGRKMSRCLGAPDTLLCPHPCPGTQRWHVDGSERPYPSGYWQSSGGSVGLPAAGN